MNTTNEVNELHQAYEQLFKETEMLNKRSNKAIKKSKELASTLKLLEKKHNNARICALICSLSTSFSLGFISLIGVFFALVPIALLSTVIVQTCRIFKLENKIDKTKKDIETCNKLLDAYNTEYNNLNTNYSNITSKIEKACADKDVYNSNSSIENNIEDYSITL